jgi:hypothetical protein
MKRLAVAIVIGLIVAASVAGASAQSDTFQAQGFHPFTMDPFNADCPSSSHTYFGLNFHNCDPVDLLVDDASLSQVTAALTSKGWTGFGFGSTQWLHESSEAIPLAQAAQLFFYERGGERRCPATVSLCRYHVRLWELPYGRGVIGAVHYEGGDFFTHVLMESWEYAEAKACSDLGSVKGFACRPSSTYLSGQARIQAGSTWRASASFSGINNNAASLVYLRADRD